MVPERQGPGKGSDVDGPWSPALVPGGHRCPDRQVALQPGVRAALCAIQGPEV